jgi:NADH:ubiquinone oxidoreductase subunit F (NADH-binding)
MTLTTARSTPLTNAAADTWTAHTDKLGPLPAADAGHLLRAVSDSGLIGRGGAGFPTGRKLATVAAGRRPVVIGNGAEGEPASAKDRYLLYTAPHLVLDGLQLAARITGAKTAYLYAPQTVLNRTVEPALKQRHDDVRIRLVASPDAFLSGEESAVVAAVQGRPAIPTSTPPRVFERGVGGRPTVVQNVESLAHIALIARFGPDWFRGQGTPDEPGTRLMTVSGAVRRPGVHEVSGGSSLEHVLARAGGISEPVSAVLVGGYHGGWVPYLGTDAPVALSRESLARYGAAPGAGVVMALARSVCGLQAAADIIGYLSGQGARQCGPCRNGLPAIATTVHELAYRPSPRLPVAEIERLSALVANRGACHHPSGTVRLVRSTLSMFAAEVALHLRGHCSATRTSDGWRR